MKLKLFIILMCTAVLLNAQTAKTFQFGGLTRDYLEYVPSIYNGSTPVPIVLCLHGLGDNMNNFFGIGMKFIADTANFIVITPEAKVDALAGGTAWNSGASYFGFQFSQTVNDVGFLNALLDTLIANYNIDQTRIYACGFSLGGFMCQRLACESTSRFAAIASVSGTQGASLTCNPSNEIPVCHFHGTLDSTVYYTNNMFGNDPEALVAYWVAFNNCNATPVHTALPDYVADGKTVDHYLYANGNNGTDVEFYKVNGGEHEWLFYPYNDITYTLEIWKFFMKYPKGPASIHEESNELVFDVFPNPASDYIMFERTSKEEISLQIIDISGKVIYENPKFKGDRISTKNWPDGIYLVKNIDGNKVAPRKILINH